jgi:hypothetical protein
MPNLAKRVVNFAERAIGCVIFIVGLRTIMDYADRNYPRTNVRISAAVLLGILIWFIIKYLAIPFAEGMRGIKTKEEIEPEVRQVSSEAAPSASPDEPST